MFTQLYEAFARWFPSMINGLGGLWELFIDKSVVDLLNELGNGLDAGFLQTLILRYAGLLNVYPFNQPFIAFTLGSALVITLAIIFVKWTLDIVT